MLFKRSTLKFFKKRFNLTYDALFLRIFDDASTRLNYPVSWLLNECADYLRVPFVGAIPTEADVVNPDDIALTNYFIATSIKGERVFFGLCPTVVDKARDQFYLTSGSAILSFLAVKLGERVRRWN